MLSRSSGTTREQSRAIEIRAGASSSPLLRGSPFQRHAAASAVVYPAGMPTFSSTYPTKQQSGKRVRPSPFGCAPFPVSASRISILRPSTRAATALARLIPLPPPPPPPPLSSEARCLDSVLLFPLQLDALANLCPRPLLYSIFRFPAFIERAALRRQSPDGAPIGVMRSRDCDCDGAIMGNEDDQTRL